MKIIDGSYDPILAALSFVIAAIASYTALDLAARVTPTNSSRSSQATLSLKESLWIFFGAVAMGTGIWSMHFIAMLAFKQPIPVAYDVNITLLSWVDAIVASGLALLLFSRPKLSLKMLLGGGVVMGLAIASMHYLGMSGMNVSGTMMHYNLGLVALSVAIAIAASSSALWLAFQFRNSSQLGFNWLKACSALVMGIAISGMHYTGMWATCFVQMVELSPSLTERSHNSWLAMQIGVATLFILTATLVSSLLDRRYAVQVVRQQALQESENRFRSLIREMPVGVLLLNPEGKIILSNQLASELLLVTEANLEGKTIFELNCQFIDENGRPFGLKEHPIKEAIAQCQTIRNCIIGIFRDSLANTIWLLINIDPHLAKDGNLERIVCTFSNITERKKAQEALAESQERFSLAVEGAAVGIWDWELLTGKFYLSPRSKSILGYEDKELPNIAETWKECIHPDDSERVTKVLFDYLENKIPVYEVEFRVRHKDGSYRWISSRGAALRSELGVPFRLSGSHTDITLRRHTEIALQESAEREIALGKVIQKMRQTLDMKEIFAATTSELRQVIKCDRVAVYRFQPDWSGEFVAESVGHGWVSLWQEQNNNTQLKQNALSDDRCVVKEFDSTAGYDDETGSSDLIRDTYLQNTQGGIYRQGTSYRVVEDIYQAGFNDCYIELLQQFQARAYIIVPIFSNNKIWGLLAIYQNSAPRQWNQSEINIVVQVGNQLGIALQQAELLERMKMQSLELQKALLAADAANRAKSEFLANMSHELRTPLNAILGFSQLIVRDNTLSTENTENLKIINRAGEHLLTLINDILEMSKIEAGKITIAENRFDLIGLLDCLQKLLHLRAESKGLNLIFEYAEDLPRYVHTDEGKLRQVLLNLLGNAIKFTAKGSVKLTVKRVNKAAETDRGQSIPNLPYPLLFEVEDTGSGIAPEEINLLFEPFRQTETGRKSQQGTGLGLAISRKYVQMMGGDIWVSSKVGLGSLFSFDIQISQVDHNDIQIPPIQQEAIALAPHQPEYRILVTDDIKDSRLLLVKLLSETGFSVCEAENGQEAVDLCQSWQPHLILMDIRMPVMDGLTATQHIKANPHVKATKILALTASAFEENRQALLASGCDGFISKPFRREILLEKISEHLGVRYIYEKSKNYNLEALDECLSPASENQQKVSQTNLVSLLSQMTDEWRSQLNHAAAVCSDDMIVELIDQIPPEHNTLISALKDLTFNFQFQKIMELTELNHEKVGAG